MNDDKKEQDLDSATTRDPIAVQAKFTKWHGLKSQGISFNERLFHNRAFHNPNIGDKMLEYFGVKDPYGSNLPPELLFREEQLDYQAMAQDQRSQWQVQNSASKASGTFRTNNSNKQ